MKHHFPYLLFFLVFGCADDRISYEGSSEVMPGIHQKLYRFGDEGRKMQAGDLASFSFVLSEYGSHEKLSQGQRHWVKGQDEIGILDSLLSNRTSGDSVAYWMSASNFPMDYLAPLIDAETMADSILCLRLRMDTVLSRTEVEREQRYYDEWVRERKNDAQLALKQHLLKEGIDPEEALFAGVYVVVENEAKGDLIAFGDEVTMHYRARFLDEQIFDDTYAGGKPLVFRCGVQGQVIWGLSLAVRKLTVGSKAKVFIPYAFGFGQQGSSTGIVPPFSNLIYDLEIVAVRKSES